jgi:hypothetical protein
MRCARAPLLLTLFLVTRSASAQRESVAEELFRDARAEMKAGHYEQACPKLAESQRLDPSPGTLLNLAICEEHVGRVATSWVRFRELLDTIGKDDPRAQIARDHLATLSPKLPRLRLVIEDEPGVEVVVRLDGVELGATVLSDLFPVDPGDHRVEVAAGPGRTRSELVSVGLGATVERKLSLPPPSAPAPTVTEGAPVTASASAPNPVMPADRAAERAPPTHSSGWNGLEVSGLVAGGLGVVTLTVAGVFALDAISLKDESNEDGHCDAHTCDAPGLKLRQQAVKKGDTATLLAVSGGALLAGGVVLYIVGRGQRQPVAVSVAISSTSPELGVRFKF